MGPGVQGREVGESTLGSGVVRCPPAAQEPAGGVEEGRPHLGRWRLASREQRGQASGTQLQWGVQAEPVGEGRQQGRPLAAFSPPRPWRHCCGAWPGQSRSRHLSSFPSRLSAELGYLMSRRWAPGLQSWWRGRGLKRMWAPRAGGSEAGPPRAGVQRFQIPEGTYLPLQNINERKFSVIKTPSLKSCCRAPSNNLL